MSAKGKKKNHTNHTAPRPSRMRAFGKHGICHALSPDTVKDDNTLVHTPATLSLAMWHDLEKRRAVLKKDSKASCTTIDPRYLCATDDFVAPGATVERSGTRFKLKGINWLTGKEIECTLSRTQAICFLGTGPVKCGCIFNPSDKKKLRGSKLVHRVR